MTLAQLLPQNFDSTVWLALAFLAVGVFFAAIYLLRKL